MATVSMDAIKQLRARTGVGINYVKEALEASGGDMDKAVIYLREKGIAKAAKRADKSTAHGTIGHYVHGNNLAVLVALHSETDFAASSDKFKELAKELALHIAAKNPEYLDRESVPASVLEVEQQIYAKEIAGKPAAVAEKILAGKLEKFYEENVLMDQTYVRDESKKIKDLLHETIASLGENIKIGQFVRMELGGETIVCQALES